MAESLPLRGDTREQLRARLGILAVCWGAAIPIELEIDAFIEWTNSDALQREWIRTALFRMPRTEAEWCRRLGVVSLPRGIDGRAVRPRDLLAMLYRRERESTEGQNRACVVQAIRAAQTPIRGRDALLRAAFGKVHGGGYALVAAMLRDGVIAKRGRAYTLP